MSVNPTNAFRLEVPQAEVTLRVTVEEPRAAEDQKAEEKAAAFPAMVEDKALNAAPKPAATDAAKWVAV